MNGLKAYKTPPSISQHLYYILGQFISIPVFDPSTNYLYITNPSNSADRTYVHGLVAFQVSDTCYLNLLWNTPFTASYLYNDDMTVTLIPGVVFVSTGVFKQVFAIDAQTGAIIWKSNIMGTVFAPPTIVNGRMFVTNCDYNNGGKSSRLWAYSLVNRPPSPAPTVAVDNYQVVISRHTYNLRSLVSGGLVDPTTGRLIQETYTGTFSSVGSTYYFRLPIAGELSVRGLPIGLDWDYADFWVSDSTYGDINVGKYSPSTWVIAGPGSATVQFIGYTQCESGGGFYSGAVTFTCGKDTAQTASVSEDSCTCTY